MKVFVLLLGFTLNVVQKQPLFAVQDVYVCGPLHLLTFQRSATFTHFCSPPHCRLHQRGEGLFLDVNLNNILNPDYRKLDGYLQEHLRGSC
jgi:hypothetical protein